MFAAQDQHGKVQPPIGAGRCPVADQCAEFELSLGQPADQRVLSRRTHRIPRAGAVPVVDESGDRPAIVASHDTVADAPRNAGDLCLGARLAQASQQMECRWLIERHGGDPSGSGQRHVQSNSTTVGVADEMNFLFAVIDERDRPGRFVGEREDVPAGPRSAGPAAVVLRRQHLIAAAEPISEVSLAGAGTRAMQGYHSSAARWPRRVLHSNVHRNVLSVLGLFSRGYRTSDGVPSRPSRRPRYRSGGTYVDELRVAQHRRAENLAHDDIHQKYFLVEADIVAILARAYDARAGCLAQDAGKVRPRPMDALSDVLRVIRLKGGVFLHAEFTAPWCISSRVTSEDCGSLLGDAEHLVLYHYVVEGRLTARIPNGKPVEIEAGEIVIFPHNNEHLLGSHIDLPPVPSKQVHSPFA